MFIPSLAEAKKLPQNECLTPKFTNSFSILHNSSLLIKSNLFPIKMIGISVPSINLVSLSMLFFQVRVLSFTNQLIILYSSRDK